MDSYARIQSTRHVCVWVHLNVCIVVAMKSSWQIVETAHWTRRLKSVKSQLKKESYTRIQLTTHAHYTNKTVLCVCPSCVYESELLAYILVIIISVFSLLHFLFDCSQCAFSCNSNASSSCAVEIKFQKIEKVKLVGSELLRRQERKRFVN